MKNYKLPVSPNQICSREQSTPGKSTVCYPVPADWRCIPDLKNECIAKNYALLLKEICEGNRLRIGTKINDGKLATLGLGFKAQ
jgi:hypothetical protein